MDTQSVSHPGVGAGQERERASVGVQQSGSRVIASTVSDGYDAGLHVTTDRQRLRILSEAAVFQRIPAVFGTYLCPEYSHEGCRLVHGGRDVLVTIGVECSSRAWAGWGTTTIRPVGAIGSPVA